MVVFDVKTVFGVFFTSVGGLAAGVGKEGFGGEGGNGGQSRPTYFSSLILGSRRRSD